MADFLPRRGSVGRFAIEGEGPVDPSDVKLIIKASKKGDLETVRALLLRDRGLVAARDKDGSTPLHCASWNGHTLVAEALLDAGAEINDHNQNDHWGTTPLHAAAHGDRKDVATLLIARGADLHSKNMHGRSPMDETTFHKARSVARLLAEHGVAMPTDA